MHKQSKNWSGVQYPLKQILPEDFTFFSKIVELSSKFQKFWYQIDKIGPILVPILEKIENMTQVYISFCTKGVIIITIYRRLILQPISNARPRIDLCIENPPGSKHGIFMLRTSNDQLKLDVTPAFQPLSFVLMQVFYQLQRTYLKLYIAILFLFLFVIFNLFIYFSYSVFPVNKIWIQN